MDHHRITPTATATATDPFKRKPGRPPKHKHRQEDFGFQLPDEQPPAQFDRHLVAEQGNDSEPIFASLGLADDAVAPTPTPPPSAKRGRGRPPKSAAAAAAVTFSGGSGSGSDLRRRKSGRPKRIGGPVTVPLSGNVRGRQPAQNTSVVNTADAGSVSRGRGRGRPPKTSGGANKMRNLTSQPFAWSNKLQVESGTAVLVTDPHQLVAFQELKLKYEHLQSKVKEVLNVIRPYVINPDYSVFVAVQELETLVTDVPSSNV